MNQSINLEEKLRQITSPRLSPASRQLLQTTDVKLKPSNVGGATINVNQNSQIRKPAQFGTLINKTTTAGPDSAAEDNCFEKRSVTKELDYTQKDAARKYATGTNSFALTHNNLQDNKTKLRQFVLKNSEGKSDRQQSSLKSGSIAQKSISAAISLRSRVTAVSNAAKSVRSSVEFNKDHGANSIEEGYAKCEVCETAITDKQDMDLCNQISKMLSQPSNGTIRDLYNKFLLKNKVQQIDFSKLSHHQNNSNNNTNGGVGNDGLHICLCTDCLIQALCIPQPQPALKQAQIVPGTSSVTPRYVGPTMFNGGMLAGIGQNQIGGQIFLDEELQIRPRKKFDKTQHQVSHGFNRLSLPANRDAAAHFTTQMASDDPVQHGHSPLVQQKVGFENGKVHTSPTRQSHDTKDAPAGARKPVQHKKTLDDKMRDWQQQNQGQRNASEAIESKKQKYLKKWGNVSLNDTQAVSLLQQCDLTNQQRVLLNQVSNHSPADGCKRMVFNHRANQDRYNKSRSINPGSAGPQPILKLPAVSFNSMDSGQVLKMNKIQRAALQMTPKQQRQNPLLAKEIDSQFKTISQKNNELLQQSSLVNHFDPSKRNFKRKTPFNEWTNACFNTGVFFNPPAEGV